MKQYIIIPPEGAIGLVSFLLKGGEEKNENEEKKKEVLKTLQNDFGGDMQVIGNYVREVFEKTNILEILELNEITLYAVLVVSPSKFKLSQEFELEDVGTFYVGVPIGKDREKIVKKFKPRRFGLSLERLLACRALQYLAWNSLTYLMRGSGNTVKLILAGDKKFNYNFLSRADRVTIGKIVGEALSYLQEQMGTLYQ